MSRDVRGESGRRLMTVPPAIKLSGLRFAAMSLRTSRGKAVIGITRPRATSPGVPREAEDISAVRLGLASSDQLKPDTTKNIARASLRCASLRLGLSEERSALRSV